MCAYVKLKKNYIHISSTEYIYMWWPVATGDKQYVFILFLYECKWKNKVMNTGHPFQSLDVRMFGCGELWTRWRPKDERAELHTTQGWNKQAISLLRDGFQIKPRLGCHFLHFLFFQNYPFISKDYNYIRGSTALMTRLYGRGFTIRVLTGAEAKV